MNDVVVSLFPVNRAARKALIDEQKRERETRGRNHVISPRTGRLMVDTRVIVPTAVRGGGLSASGVTGTIADDSQITIAWDGANGFSADGPTVELYDDFRNGTVGQIYGLSNPVIGSWSAYDSGSSSNHPILANDQSLNKGQSLEVVDSTRNNNKHGINYVKSGGTTEFFTIFWTRNNNSHSEITVGQWKYTWYIDTNTGSNSDGRYDLVFPNKVSGDAWECSGNDGRRIGNWTSSSITKDVWHRAAWWERDDSPTMSFYQQRVTPDVAHESVDEGDLPSSADTMFELFSSSTDMNYFKFPGFANTAHWTTPAKVHFDCIYIASANGAARVEIGDNATYSSCTYLDIATVDSWSNTSITCTIRQQSLSSFDGTYIHIHDKDNNYVGSSRLIS